jgi:hypothetical protein
MSEILCKDQAPEAAAMLAPDFLIYYVSVRRAVATR